MDKGPKAGNQSTISPLSSPTQPRQPRRRGGFTLVEMLVVVLIMALLVGLLVRTLGGAGMQSDKAVTQATVEKVKAALEEFFAEYGQYPPVPFYEEGNGKIQPIYMEYPMEWHGQDAKWSGTAQLSAWQGIIDGNTKTRLFTFGLVSFLVPRYKTVKDNSLYFKENETALNNSDNKQWGTYTPAAQDQVRDLNACERWKPFLDGIIVGGEKKRGPDPKTDAGITHINSSRTIVDSWEQELRYESLPPHQSYKLWSKGPNKKDEQGRGDDLGVFMNH